MNEDVTVVVPAAGRVPDGLIALSNVGCPAMIPVAGRPVIYWTMRYLRSLGLRRFRIAVASRGMFVEDFVECAFAGECDVEFVVPSRQSGLGRTVLDLLEGVTTRAALVVLGDTHFSFADAGALATSTPFVLTQPVEESFRWCTAEVGVDGVVARLHDKVAGLPTPAEALVGVYWFPDVEAARVAARAAVVESEGRDARAEMASILERLMQTGPMRALRAGQWMDVGNPDTHATSQRAMLAAREFNEIHVDPILGTLTKSSRHADKLRDEIAYLRALPPEVAVLFPRVIHHDVAGARPSVTMEYYGYPTLSEVFVFEGVDPAIWERVFEHLLAVVERSFVAHERALAPGALWNMCVDKTRARVAQLGDDPMLRRMLCEPGEVRINGVARPSLESMWPRIEARVRALEASATGSLIHGDLCFSNILYDLRARIVKLIDPRGSFGAPGAAGDIRYDVAKLYHSVAGLYDFIIHDLFTVEVARGELSLAIRRRPDHEEIQRRFERVFFARFSRADVELLTGLLFASMPPLHADAPRRQLAMAARALELLSTTLEREP